jgi:DHA1 family bicyclomycin/chloramphenicol resistance-like MFS transporter
VSPILAPIAGSGIIAVAGWRAIFWVVAVAALLGMILNALLMNETRPPAQRVDSSIRSALAGYRVLLADRTFLGLVFTGAFGISSFFAYLANSSFVLIQHYGLTPALYSVAFSINAVAFIGMSQLNGRLARRYGLERTIRTAVIGYAAAMVALAAVTAAGIDRLEVMAPFLFVGYGFLGMVIPTSAVLALETHGAIAGTASALMGTLQFVTGAATIAVLGPFVDGTALPMIAGIAACAALSFTFAQVTLRRRGRPSLDAAPAE